MHPLALLSLVVVLSQPAGALHAQPSEGAQSEAAQAFRGSLARGATVEYERFDPANRVRSTVTLASAGGDEYLYSSGSRLKDLVELVADPRHTFSPPIPLAKLPLEVGATWRHAATMSERFGIRAAQVDSRFTVVGRSVLVTGAGPREAFEVQEIRTYAGHEVSTHRWFDTSLGLMLKQTWKVVLLNQGPQGSPMQYPVRDFEMTVTRIP
jgi:hypothetical protein